MTFIVSFSQSFIPPKRGSTSNQSQRTDDEKQATQECMTDSTESSVYATLRQLKRGICEEEKGQKGVNKKWR